MSTNQVHTRCRICYSNENTKSMLSPCNCKGSIGHVHLECLERWIVHTNGINTMKCEICLANYKGIKFVEAIPSFWQYVKAEPYQNVFPVMIYILLSFIECINLSFGYIGIKEYYSF